MDTVIVAFAEAMWSDPATVADIVGCRVEVLEHEQALREYVLAHPEETQASIAEELAACYRAAKL